MIYIRSTLSAGWKGVVDLDRDPNHYQDDVFQGPPAEGTRHHALFYRERARDPLFVELAKHVDVGVRLGSSIVPGRETISLSKNLYRVINLGEKNWCLE